MTDAYHVRKGTGREPILEPTAALRELVTCRLVTAAADFRALCAGDVLLVDPGAAPRPGDVLADVDGGLAVHPARPPGDLVGVVVDLKHRERGRL